MAEQTKKYAFKRLKRVNGQYVVVYIDSQTGEEISNLNGYSLATGEDSRSMAPNTGIGGSSDEQSETPVEGPSRGANTDSDGGSANTNFWQDSDWANDPNRSKGTGDIFGDFHQAHKTLNKGVENAKNWLFGGIASQIGKAMGQDIASNTTPKQVVDDVKANVGNAVSGAMDKAGSWLSGITGGGQTVATETGERYRPPNEVLSYQAGFEAKTRTIPVSNQYATVIAAALQSVDPKLTAVISSAGQPKGTYENGKRVSAGTYTDEHGHTHSSATGGPLHDVDENGNATTADLFILYDGKQISPKRDSALSAEIVKAFTTVGMTGIGVSEGEGFFHIGAKGNAVWGYGPAGGKNIYAPEWLTGAYAEGKALNAKGEGNRIIEAYVETTIAPEVDKQIAGNAPQPVNPKIADIVNTQREAAGLRPAEPLFSKNKDTRYSPTLDVSMSTPNAVTPSLGANGQVQQVAGTAPVGPTDQMQTAFNPSQPFSETTQVAQAAPQGEMVGSSALSAIDQAAPRNNPVPASDMMSAYVGQEVSLPTPSFQDGLTAPQRALLDTIRAAEGGRDYNILFGDTASNPKVFDTYSRHPNKYNAEYDTTAAGAYQINYPTYNEFAKKIGVNDFSPESQDKIALAIAEYEYGPNIWKDLETGKYEQVTSALNGRWPSLEGGSQQRMGQGDFVSSFESNLTKYNEPVWTPPTIKQAKPDTISTASTDYYVDKNQAKLDQINATKSAQKQALSQQSTTEAPSGIGGMAPKVKDKTTTIAGTGGLGSTYSDSGTSGGIATPTKIKTTSPVAEPTTKIKTTTTAAPTGMDKVKTTTSTPVQTVDTKSLSKAGGSSPSSKDKSKSK